MNRALILCVFFLHVSAFAETAGEPSEVSADPQPTPKYSLGVEPSPAAPANLEEKFNSPERVFIYSINGRAEATHPGIIDVPPGTEVQLQADVLQFGNACPHPEGCPEGREGDQFIWSADDRAGDECIVRLPETCRDQTNFQIEGNSVIFHVPYAMGRKIIVQVRHAGLESVDTLVLHNAHLPKDRNSSFATTPPGYYDNEHDDRPLYPSLAPSGVNEPYWGGDPYYPYGAYPYWGGAPYGYYGWGWGGGGTFVSVGFAFGPGWGWPYYGGWYRPGYAYGYRPGWWGPGWAGGPHLWRPYAGPAYAPHPIMPGVATRLNTGPGPRPVNRGWRRRGRWR